MCLLRGTDWMFIYASLTFSNSTFCPHSVFMCFVWIWEQTAIISLYRINWLVCITETECVYCVVRTGSLYIIQFNITVYRGFIVDLGLRVSLFFTVFISFCCIYEQNLPPGCAVRRQFLTVANLTESLSAPQGSIILCSSSVSFRDTKVGLSDVTATPPQKFVRPPCCYS